MDKVLGVSFYNFLGKGELTNWDMHAEKN
jgi:hypothetical protein